MFLLTQLQNTCRCRIRSERSLNCITSSIVTNFAWGLFAFHLPTLFCCVCFLMTSIPLWWRYIISFIVEAANPGSFPNISFTSAMPTFLFFCCFAQGRFARFHVRPESFRITVATPPHVVSPNNRFCKIFLCAIMFVTDADISLYSNGGENMQYDYIRQTKRVVVSVSKATKKYSVIAIVADLVRRETYTWSRFAQTVKRLSHIFLWICHPYQLDDSTFLLKAASCLVSFWIYFEYNFL